MPPTGWTETEFDDARWNRKPITDPDSAWIGLLCIRGRFNVDDPEKVQGTKLTVKYRGGVAVYLNGKEIARGNLKAGAGPKDLADDYPNEDMKQPRQLTDVRISAAPAQGRERAGAGGRTAVRSERHG